MWLLRSVWGWLRIGWLRRCRGAAALGLALCLTAPAFAGTQSVARQWNEELLNAIRHDLARPTVHARNLFHVSAAMWDAWAAYDDVADQYLHHEKLPTTNAQADRKEAISYAAFRLLYHRFSTSVGAADVLPALINRMVALGYDITDSSTVGDSPAALGNRIAASYIAYGLTDGSNEANNFANTSYQPVNEPIVPDLPGNPDIVDPNRWQEISLNFFVDQSGHVIPFGYPPALSPEWGIVKPFSLELQEANVYSRDGFDYWVYHDPGPPPHVNGVGDDYYKWGFEMVCAWSSHLDPTDGVMIDISPGSIGNTALPDVNDWAAYYDFANGGDIGTGHPINPVTGLPYAPNVVPRGDYARVLAEFWADGPNSETPPGHWFTILNYVNDHPLFEKRMAGVGPILPDLEWDVKAYLAMGGMMHDVAITAWGIKGWYDFIRPISAIRWMCDQGQCSDPGEISYDPSGIDLHAGLIEVVTAASSAPGQHHEHLAAHVGKIAIKAWRGPEFIADPATDDAGVGWILAENWWPYQRPSFVTPPFPGFVSGHSTFSRGASELMTLLTGSAFFPGGLGEFHCPQNQFLVFEEGPSQDITLQWATYRDASDQTSLSRIWGGIHPPADDLPGRQIGQVIGPEAFNYAVQYFEGVACHGDANGDGAVDLDDLQVVLYTFGTSDVAGDLNHDGNTDLDDLMECLTAFGGSCGPT
ncbi:MAG: hypothetical protein KDA20_03560 [Phycisphaerales bacterium]|nr:hypothetical protein [Phycisphaerales bacterium]